MKHSWRLGRVAGIDIMIDSSWLVIFILFTWVLASSYFPQRYPGWPVSQYFIMGVITCLLIFGSVLVHEFAHSLVAIRQGKRVHSITLFILGGVAQITDEPKQPFKEFLMALVGPVSSFFMAIFFFFLSFLLKGVSLPLSASAAYLSIINTALAIFNLLPGFPMDGGRILRSILWKFTGNLKKATKIASRTGQGFAFFLIFIGIFQIMRGTISGFWLIFVGWFLHSAAVRGYQNIMVEATLKGVRAEDLMNKNFKTVTSDLYVKELVDDYILKKKERVFLVVDEDKLKGIVCMEDVKRVPQEKRSQMQVGEIMTPREKLEAVTRDADGRKILRTLTTHNIHQIPVMDGERIAGIICRSDILQYIQFRSELGV